MALQQAKYMLLGGIVFWVPDAACMLLAGIVPMNILIAGKTVLLPSIVVVAIRTLAKLPAGKCSTLAKSFLLVAGIWLFGPVDLVLTSLVAEKMHMSPQEALFHIALFPLSTIVVALYSGALGALIVTTAILCLFPFFHAE
jgi:hypothetical protein